MIIGITGTIAAGKTTTAKYLESKGFKIYSVRDFLIKEIKSKNMQINRDSMVSVANELRKNFGADYIVRKIYDAAAKDSVKNAVVESIRSPYEVETLKKYDNFLLLSIDADQKTRYSRLIKRSSETDNIDFEVFLENEKREMSSADPLKQDISKCINLADFKINNNGTLEEFYSTIDRISLK